MLHRLFSGCGKQWLLSTCIAMVPRCPGFSRCRAVSLGHMGSVVAVRRLHSTGSIPVAQGLISCSWRPLEHAGFRSCGTQAQLLLAMWDLPRPGIKPVCPALAGRCLSTAPPGKPLYYFLSKSQVSAGTSLVF